MLAILNISRGLNVKGLRTFCRTTVLIHGVMTVHLVHIAIKISFCFKQDFSLEYGENDCQFDYVLVESGHKDRKKKLCGPTLSEETKVQTSRLNKMVIRFHTDASHSDRGFRAVYETGKH